MGAYCWISGGGKTMSALMITSSLLLQSSEISQIVDKRIFELFAPQGMMNPSIIIHLIHQEEEYLLQGGGQQPRARVSIECRAMGNVDPMQCDILAEAVIDYLRDQFRVTVGDFIATFQKEGSDETDSSSQNDEGNPWVCRRIVDFYVQYERSA